MTNSSYAVIYEYDDLDRLIKANYENGFMITYQYDAQGNILQIASNSDPDSVDSDNDLIPDTWEDANGLNKNDPSDATLDPDNDNLNNLAEFQNNTLPNNPDTDGDGLTDGEEITLNTDPTKKDTDGDGFSDKAEIDSSTDPLDAQSRPLTKNIPVFSGWITLILILSLTLFGRRYREKS